MGTTLTGTTPQDTYDSLIKVTDNGPLSGSLKVLTDGLGNNSAISLSTTAASVTGTLAVSSNTTLTSNGISLRLGSATSNAGANILIAGASSTKNWSLGVQQNVSGALEFTPTATNGATTLGTTPAMVILDGGNVGIGITAPDDTLHLNKSGAGVYNAVHYTNPNSTASLFVGIGGSSVANSSLQNNAYVYNAAASAIVLGTNDAERMRITSDGYMRMAASTGGIQFNGDTAAANALDDYEEGTFTPTIIGTTTAGTATYGGGQQGLYTKIGRMVYFSIYLGYSGGTGTGDLRIAGLPFTIASADIPSFSIGTFLNVALTASNVPLTSGVGNSTQVRFDEIPTGGGTQSAVPYDAAAVIAVSGFYQV